MSSTSDKAKGLANEAVGNIKQGVGKVTDNDKLRAEGKAQEVKGGLGTGGRLGVSGGSTPARQPAAKPATRTPARPAAPTAK